MGIVKQFTISKSLKLAAGKSLSRHLPSDILYSVGAAMYEKSNERGFSPSQREFFRKATERVLSTVKSIRTLEEQYYVSKQ